MANSKIMNLMSGIREEVDVTSTLLHMTEEEQQMLNRVGNTEIFKFSVPLSYINLNRIRSTYPFLTFVFSIKSIDIHTASFIYDGKTALNSKIKTEYKYIDPVDIISKTFHTTIDTGYDTLSIQCKDGILRVSMKNGPKITKSGCKYIFHKYTIYLTVKWNYNYEKLLTYHCINSNEGVHYVLE